MTTGCFADSFEDDDDGRTSAHNQKENKTMDSAMAKVLAGMADDDYAELIAAVNTARKQAKPSLADGAALLAQGDGMRIPGGSLTPRMRRMLADANGGDTFRIDRDQAQNIDLSK